MKGHFAASFPKAWISFCAAVDTHAHATGWTVQFVQGLAVRISDHHARNAIPTQFLDFAELLIICREGHFLITAAFCTAWQTFHRPMHGENFALSVNFFHDHGEFVTTTAANTHETVALLKGGTKLGILPFCGFEPFELISRFAPKKQLLDTAFSCLTNGHIF
jgi:hypothetical protein